MEILFALLISGGIGAALGTTIEKSSMGFWLGLFLGPIGWILVFLLPRKETGANTAIQKTTPLSATTEISYPEYPEELTEKMWELSPMDSRKAAMLAIEFGINNHRKIISHCIREGVSFDANVRIPAERDLDSDAYKLWLSSRHGIEKNQVFEKFVCAGKLFDSLNEALSFAHAKELEIDVVLNKKTEEEWEWE